MQALPSTQASRLDLPQRPASPLTVQRVGSGPARELLLYCESSHRAFCLSPLAAVVWELTDGTRDAAALAQAAAAALAAPVEISAVELALLELRRDGLLLPPAVPALPPGAVDSGRRKLLAQAGAGAALLVPAVAMILAPKAAQAYGGCLNCTPASSSQRLRREIQDQQNHSQGGNSSGGWHF